jgi:hypothetical protein
MSNLSLPTEKGTYFCPPPEENIAPAPRRLSENAFFSQLIVLKKIVVLS